MKEIHFYDLDGTLFNIDARIWVIDKEHPNIPLVKITPQELYMIQNGLYKKYNLLIDYNDQEFYISKDLFNRINKVKRIIDMNRLGVSFIEFYNDEYINNNKIKFLIPNIRHLAGTNVPICILTGRPNRERHANLLNELRIKLKSLGLEIFKVYFVSDHLQMRHQESISLNKVNILLEHLIGLKIQNNKFISLRQDEFDKVYFYDDEIRNIQYANDMQTFFERVMKNSDDEMFQMALEKVKSSKLTLINNLVTSNELNRFKTSEVVLHEPTRFPIKENLNIIQENVVDNDVQKYLDFMKNRNMI